MLEHTKARVVNSSNLGKHPLDLNVTTKVTDSRY